MGIEFHRSAFRHGIDANRIRHVIDHCPSPLYPPPDDHGARDLVVFLGHDQFGVALEVIAVEGDAGVRRAIHAMRIRRKYEPYLREQQS